MRRPSFARVGYHFFVDARTKRIYDDNLENNADKLIERNITISDFHSTSIFQQFTLRGWLGMCSGHVAGCPELVKEFFANAVSVNSELGYFITTVRNKTLCFFVEAICELVTLPSCDRTQWPLEPALMPPRTEVLRELTGGVFNHVEMLRQGQMTPQYCLLNRIVCAIIEPTDHIHEVSNSRAYLLYGIGLGCSIDLAWKIWTKIWKYSTHPPGTGSLPFQSLITRSCLENHVQVFSGEGDTPLEASINLQTMTTSEGQVSFDGLKLPSTIPMPAYPIVEPMFLSIYPPPDYVSLYAHAAVAPPLELALPSHEQAPPLIDFMGILHDISVAMATRLDEFSSRMNTFDPQSA